MRFSCAAYGDFLCRTPWTSHVLPVASSPCPNQRSRDEHRLQQQHFRCRLQCHRFILVASWSSSTVFPFMGLFVIVLSFPVTAETIRNSRSPFLDMLLSPNQLALLIDLLDGKRSALWQWLLVFGHESKPKRACVGFRELGGSSCSHHHFEC